MLQNKKEQLSLKHCQKSGIRQKIIHDSGAVKNVENSVVAVFIYHQMSLIITHALNVHKSWRTNKKLKRGECAEIKCYLHLHSVE